MDTNIGEDFRQVDPFIGVAQQGQNKTRSWLRSLRDRMRDGIARLRKWSLRFPYAKPLPQEGRDAEIIKLITRLQKFREIPSKELRTGADASITRVTNLLRLISVGPFLVILAALGVFLLNVVDPAYPRFVAVTADLALMIMVLFWIALDTAIPLFCIVFAPEFEFRTRQFELAHDLRMAAELREFELDTLKAGEQWLGIKLERLKFRMVLMFGGSDKLALFALVGLAWAMKKLLQSNEGLFSQQWMTYILAGLLGATIGGVLANVIVKRLLYQKDIVTLAIREREEIVEGNPKP